MAKVNKETAEEKTRLENQKEVDGSPSWTPEKIVEMVALFK